MRRRNVAAALAAIALVGTGPAWAGDVSGAERLRRLDIMLEVGSQRCEAGGQDFARDYRRFAAAQRREIGRAEAELRRDLTLRYGASRADSELERRGTALANTYGQGHPWLDCAQLALVARNLAQVLGRATLEEAADQLIRPSARIASIP